MKRIRTTLSEFWYGVKLFFTIAAITAGFSVFLLYIAPVCCRYLTADIVAAVIGVFATGAGIAVVLGVLLGAVLNLRQRCRSGIRYRKQRIDDRARRCLGYPTAEWVCDAVRRNYGKR